MKYLGPPQSGSVANQTFSHCRGQYVKARAGRGGPGDTVFTGLPALWQGLTDDQRQQWNEFARLNPSIDRLGQRTQLSGFGWFCAQNRTVAAWTGGPGFYSVPFVPLESPPFGLFTLTAASFVAGQLHVTLEGDSGTQGGGMVDACGPTGYIGSGIMSPPGTGSFWVDLFGAVPVVGDNSTGTSWFLRFGAVVPGQRVAIGWRPLLFTGRWGARQSLVFVA